MRDFLGPTVRTEELPTLACVASVSVWFRSKERPRNGILGFGRARNGHLPALLLTPFFARSLTLVPRPLLLNRTETLATQAIPTLFPLVLYSLLSHS